MNKDKLILKNGYEVVLESGASISNILVLFQNKEKMLATWDELNEKNLSEVVIRNEYELTIGRYENLLFDSETSTPRSDGSILTSFHLREKTEVEKDIDSLKAGQEVLTGAIDDLGAVTSALAEAREGEIS